MASFSSYSEDLTCSICRTIFNDPVILHCGHSFCRDCITLSLSSLLQCPQCQAAISAEGTGLTTNHILKSLSEKAKNSVRPKREQETDKKVFKVDGWYCPEHEEKIKLFCITDQQPACIICRDGKEHNGHVFKPVKEAAAMLMEELHVFAKKVSDDNVFLEDLVTKQKEEMSKSKEKGKQLRDQFRIKFEAMHQFLRKREGELRKELELKEDEEFQKMRVNLNNCVKALSESRELDQKVKSFVKMTDPERFLKKWTEETSVQRAKILFSDTEYCLNVEDASLSLFPHESHLQFFVWKEMLQVIQPREVQLTLEDENSDFKLSVDRRSLLPACTQCKSLQQQLKNYKTKSLRGPQQLVQAFPIQPKTYVLSTDEFSSGQHYWEIDVGNKSYWEVGIQKYLLISCVPDSDSEEDNCSEISFEDKPTKHKYFLKYDGSYSVCEDDDCTEISFEGRPTKIGVFLNYSKEELSFYDANNMKQIYTITVCDLDLKVEAYLSINQDQDSTPLIVCWY